jgi:hypothetical protein
MSWSLKFDEPIALAKGKTLRTLRRQRYSLSHTRRERDMGR